MRASCDLLTRRAARKARWKVGSSAWLSSSRRRSGSTIQSRPIVFVTSVDRAGFAVSSQRRGVMPWLRVSRRSGHSCWKSAASARLLPPVETALIGALDAPLAPFWVWLFLGERLDEATLLGGSVVMAAVLLHVLFDLRRREAMPGAA